MRRPRVRESDEDAEAAVPDDARAAGPDSVPAPAVSGESGPGRAASAPEPSVPEEPASEPEPEAAGPGGTEAAEAGSVEAPAEPVVDESATDGDQSAGSGAEPGSSGSGSDKSTAGPDSTATPAVSGESGPGRAASAPEQSVPEEPASGSVGPEASVEEPASEPEPEAAGPGGTEAAEAGSVEAPAEPVVDESAADDDQSAGSGAEPVDEAGEPVAAPVESAGPDSVTTPEDSGESGPGRAAPAPEQPVPEDPASEPDEPDSGEAVSVVAPAEPEPERTAPASAAAADSAEAGDTAEDLTGHEASGPEPDEDKAAVGRSGAGDKTDAEADTATDPRTDTEAGTGADAEAGAGATGAGAAEPGASARSSIADLLARPLTVADEKTGPGTRSLGDDSETGAETGAETEALAAEGSDAEGPEDGEAVDLPPSYPPTRRPRPLPIPGQEDDASGPRPRRGWLSTVIVVLVVIALSAFIKTHIVQTFEIPSGSMEDTLRTGDQVSVRMYDAHNIHRGDVVVFSDPGGWLDDAKDPTGLQGLVRSGLILTGLLPKNSGHHLIKRVIGVAGDHITADGTSALSVNGVPLDETYVRQGAAPSSVPFDVVVPEGCVWVMGDNRSNSSDSRFHQDDPHGGAVPLTDVVGVATNVVWPVGHWDSLDDGEAVFKDVPDDSH